MKPVANFADPAYWEELIQRGPRDALASAEAFLATDVEDPDARVLALRTASRSLFELGRLADAADAARGALSGVGATSAQVRRAATMTAAIIVAEAGDVEVALDRLRELADESEGVWLGRVRVQMACVLLPAGRIEEALTQLDQSERVLTREGDDGDRYRVHSMRGYALLQTGRLASADIDFEIAQDIALRTGMTMGAAQAHANRGVLHGRARRLQRSIEHFDTAARLYAECGSPGRTVAWTEIDRAEVMMHVGLVADAVDAAARAVELVAEGDNRMAIGDAHLVLARAQLAARQYVQAERTANAAAELFERSGRSSLLPHARLVVGRARLERAVTPDEVRSEIDALAPLVEELSGAGWDEQLFELSYARVAHAHRTGLAHSVASDLELLRGGTDDERPRQLMRCFAEAVSLAGADDPREARAAAIRGLDHLDTIVAEAESLRDRSAAMSLGSDLSRLAIELSIVLDDPATVFAAAEGTRARALHDELQQSDRHRPLTEDGAARLRRELAGRLEGRCLVEWVIAGRDVWAVVHDTSGMRLVRVADERDVVQAADRVLISLDLAASDPDGSSARAERAARDLDRLLMAPLDLDEHAGVVVVPDGLLHGVPWAGLPSLAGVPVSLAPSAQLWLEADRRAAGRIERVGLIAGPDVESTAPERDAVIEHYRSPAIAEGAGATAGTVRSMFAGYDLVHVAAHGRFRSDRPLLSTLRLHEGEATLHDAIPDDVAARVVVMSSCEGGAQGTADGSEVLGLASVLLARGAASVVAPLTVVRDLECAEFVAELHADLASGASVARAVSNVRLRWLADDDLSRWAVASSFSCFGSGAARVAI